MPAYRTFSDYAQAETRADELAGDVGSEYCVVQRFDGAWEQFLVMSEGEARRYEREHEDIAEVIYTAQVIE